MIQESLIIDVHASSKNLTKIDDCIRKIKDNDFPQLQCAEIGKILSMEFKPVVVENIYIVESDKNTPFFGSRIFPSQVHLKQVLEENRDEQRSHIIFERCVIELDSKLFYDLPLSERQITAIILHEVGHALSDRQLIKPRALLSSCCTLPMGLVSPFNYNLYNLLLSGLAVFYDSKKIINKKNNRNEIEADSLALACGYGEELASALGVLSHYIKYDPVSSVAYAQNELKWGIDAIANFEIRQNAILKELEQRMTVTDSPYMKNIIAIQISSVKERIDQARKRKASSSMSVKTDKLDEACNNLLEGLILRRNQYGLEADLISMEIGRIETTEDKLYLTNRVHKNITIARKSLEKIAKRDPKDPRIPLLQDNIRKLETLIPEIKAVKTDINPFVIKVAYPKDDYEN